jgi:hypothetical protein
MTLPLEDHRRHSFFFRYWPLARNASLNLLTTHARDGTAAEVVREYSEEHSSSESITI